MPACEDYYAQVSAQLALVWQSQRSAIETGAGWIGQALVCDHWLYAFGTGHSHLLAEEIFFRAGGLARAAPILDEKLMLHRDAIEATSLERREAYAESILGLYPVEQGDVLLVISNSGRNAVPIEMTLAAQQRGLKVVAITNFAQSRAWTSRHPSGKRLMEVADLAIDNCGVDGDASVTLNGLPGKIGPTSTITGAFVVNLLIARALEIALAHKIAPEIYISSNTNGDAHNDLLLSKYRRRIRHL